MTSGAAQGTYRRLFARPHAVALLGWSLVARLPLGMVPLGLLLLARGEGASYSRAGAVSAAYVVALAVGAPIAGRLVDKRGPRRILLQRAVAYPTLLGLVVLLALVDAPMIAIGLAAAAAGSAFAPVAPTVRTVWPRLAPADLRSSAYALEASMQEIFFVGGPLLVAGLAVVDPVAGVVGAAIAAAVGTVAVAGLPPVRETGDAGPRGGSLLGALEAPGVRTLVAFAFTLGLAFGAVEVGMPAFAESHGARELGGVALATLSAGSFAGGLLAGARPSSNVRRRLLVAAPAIAVSLALLVFSWSILSLCLLAFAAGLPLAPGIAAVYGLIDRVAPSWAIAEAFAWFGMAVALGAGLGIALGGSVIDHLGVRAAFVLGPVAAACGAALLLRRRRFLA